MVLLLVCFWLPADCSSTVLIDLLTSFASSSGTFLALYFSVRSRALASFITSILSILANLILGVFLDMKRFSQTFKARSAFIAIAVLNVGMWVWQTSEYESCTGCFSLL